MIEKSEKKNNLFDSGKKLLSMYIENVKLTSAEKLTVLFSSVALFVTAFVLGIIGMIFISIGLASMLEDYIAPFWSYFIIAAVFLGIVAVLIIFKTQIIVNPIARFISKLLIDPPSNKI